MGSSPRGRGKHDLTIAIVVKAGLIPAWAGKTGLVSSGGAGAGAHPRVGGENGPGIEPGLHSPGSSPRGRGKLRTVSGPQHCAGLIPAWAGKTWVWALTCTFCEAHPRVGGENRPFLARREPASGSSPRGRGKRTLTLLGLAPLGLIPAWAGKTRTFRA